MLSCWNSTVTSTQFFLQKSNRSPRRIRRSVLYNLVSLESLWGSIGYATPSAFGAAVAAPDRRLVLVTGDGSHQLTAQEISQFGRRGLKPIVFLLNNNGYLIERLLCKNPAMAYNDLASWEYSKLPEALGCKGWFTARVKTCGEFDQALKASRQ